MKLKTFLVTIALLAVAAAPVLAQVSTRAGSIYGKVNDDKGQPLPGVTITLESTEIQPQTSTTGPAGGFRFANLPPGMYSATFSIEGFTEVRQEEVRVSVGGEVQLQITLNPTLTEEFVVVADTPVVDTKKTGNESSFNREYLDKVPSGRDPWVIIEQTPGVDNDRINIAGSESGQQTGFFARGASFTDNAWNYDGVNATDPLSLGASPTYYDFDAFEEIQIMSGGSDASVQAKGVVVNLVTKRAGNKLEANASYYFTNESLQSDNTPEELIELGVLRSNRIDQVYDVGFDIGGPIVKDRLFAWGAWRRNQIDLFTRVTDPNTGLSLSDKTKLTDLNFKANFNANAANESQFGYFDGAKEKDGRGFDPPTQAEETLWQQGSPGTILEGIWTGQHTLIPNDHTILNARYGYIGLSFELSPNGGNCAASTPCDIPMIFLAVIPHWEDTSFNVSPIDRPSHDFNADMNWFKENWGGDHEFKFGFEYKASEGHTFSSYGNGALIADVVQTTPGGPLIAGAIYAQRFINGTMNYYRASGYVTDTWRMDRLTLNLGFRVDSGSGENQASSVPAPAGFDAFISGVDFAGNDRSKVYTDISPRLGATYDITGDGRTILRGNYARYYDGYVPFYDTYANPTYVYNGVILGFTNSNGDRVITPDEVTRVFGYYGGAAPGPFDQAQFDALKRIGDIESAVTDEFVVGFEREVVRDLALYVSFTHRTYDNFTQTVPFGVTPEDYAPAGVFTFSHPEFGDFSVPFSDLTFAHDGTQLLKTIDGYTQTYNGVDFGARKRMSNNFMLNAFVTLQRQKAHYDGGDSFFVVSGDGINLRTVYADPALVSFYDDQPYAFVSGGSGKTGVFPFAEWTFRASGIYQLPWDLSLGGFVRYQQGFPQPLFAELLDDEGNPAPGNLFNFYAQGRLILLEPIGTRRYDNIFTLDLNVQKVFELSNYGRITVAVDVFNITNENTVVQRQRRVTTASFNELQENLSPRAVRLGFKYSF
ncbi:TonB-dependent receptor [bacterium]|nr:TonB-dependent receptor [bacterium]MCI0601750.1 TonB-dependent receptor [bacterium]